MEALLAGRWAAMMAAGKAVHWAALTADLTVVDLVDSKVDSWAVVRVARRVVN